MTTRKGDRVVNLQRRIDRLRDWKDEEMQKGPQTSKATMEYLNDSEATLITEMISIEQQKKASVVPGSFALCAYWEELKTADFDEHGVLKLREGVFFLGKKDFGSRIMQREVHKQLWATVEALREKGVKDLVVRGTPGTGKSCWLYLVMLEGARRGVKIVLQHSVLKARFLFDGSTVQEGDSSDFRAELQDPNVWYLVDGEAATVVDAQTFMVVSPEYRLYHKFTNTASRAAIRFMPTWTLEELQKARDHIYKDEISEDRLVELYTQWGGIPRYCLQFANSKVKQNDLVAALHRTDLSQLFKAVGSLETASNISHIILHWAVSEDLEEQTVVWASKYVAREMMHRVRMEARMDLVKELVVCMGIRERASIAGAGFEAMFHTMMQEGPTFPCRDLEDPIAPQESVTFPKARLHCFIDKNDVTNVKDADYFVPSLQSYKAVDSLLLDNSAFQATVAESHPVLNAGLEDALGLLPDCDSYKLYFALPEQRYKEFTKQKLITKEGGEVQNPRGRVKKIRQYALLIKM